MLLGVISDPFPKQAQNNQIPVLAMNASTTQLDNFRPQPLKCLEVKFLSRVITKVILRVSARLQTVSADDVPGWQVLHHQVVTNRIKGVFLSAGGDRLEKLRPSARSFDGC